MVAVPDPGQILKTFGGQVDVRVEVDTGLADATFGVWGATTGAAGANWSDGDTWGAVDPAWNDVTEFVLDVSIDGGTERWGERYDTGVASITVDNTDGRWSPASGVDAYNLPFRPGRAIRVVAIPDPDDPTEKAPLFTGNVDSANEHYHEAGYDIVSVLTCFDHLALLAAFNPLATTPTGVQATHERVEAALDRLPLSWPAGLRDIQTGEHTMQSSDLAQTTLEEVQRAADAEGGALFAAPDGVITFKARDWLITDTRSTEVQAFIGYGDVTAASVQAAHIIDVETSWELARVVNMVQFSGGLGASATYEVEDSGSQSAYGIRTYNRTDLQNNDPADVEFLADRYLAAFKDLRPRIDSVTILAVDDPDNEDKNRLFWDAKYGDLVSIRVATPYGWEYEREVHITAINHVITADDWMVTFRLDDAQTIE